tara:strand:- start:2657 stop:3310 length:654 start_codon:yes stop_codon:yes gene_type:complete
MRIGILAKKIGMTSYFDDDGTRSPATLLHIDNCEVTNVMTKEKNNYIAVQIGLVDQKNNKIKKPQKNHFTNNKSTPKKYLKEFRVSDDKILEIGTKITVEHFKKGQFVDVTSISKGKGFAGSMKRHNFSGGRASHGNSISHRAHGSTGNNQDPGRVFKGKKMAGHMGSKQVTIQNLKIIDVDKLNNLVIIKGSVPGSRQSLVSIKDSIKKRDKKDEV